jgi:hypothetical protein
MIGRRSLVVGGLFLGTSAFWRPGCATCRSSAPTTSACWPRRTASTSGFCRRNAGLIFDRNGVLLAGNEQNYRITLVREDTDDVDAVLDGTFADREPRPRRAGARPRGDHAPPALRPVTVADRLSWEELSSVAVNAPALPGVNPEVGLSRVYPLGADFAHVVGYVGPVSDYYIEQTGDTDPVLQIPDFQVGRYNVEARMEAELRGRAGTKQVEVNAAGREMRELDRDAAIAGSDVQLTIDAGSAELCRGTPDRRKRGRRRDGLHQRRDPGARLRADLRPEPLRARHQPDAVDRPQRGPLSPAGQQGDPGPLPAGLDLQDDRGAGRAGSRGRRHREEINCIGHTELGNDGSIAGSARGMAAWTSSRPYPKAATSISTTSPSASGSRRSRPWRCAWAAVCATTCRSRASRRASRPRCSGNGGTAARTGSSATRSTRLSGRASC